MSTEDIGFRGLTYAEEEAMDNRLNAANVQIVGVNYDMPPHDVLEKGREHLVISIGGGIYCLEQFSQGWLVTNECGYQEWKPARLQWGRKKETLATSLYEALDIAIDDANWQAGFDRDDPEQMRRWEEEYQRKHGPNGTGWPLRRLAEERLAKAAREPQPAPEPVPDPELARIRAGAALEDR